YRRRRTIVHHDHVDKNIRRKFLRQHRIQSSTQDSWASLIIRDNDGYMWHRLPRKWRAARTCPASERYLRRSSFYKPNKRADEIYNRLTHLVHHTLCIITREDI